RTCRRRRGFPLARRRRRRPRRSRRRRRGARRSRRRRRGAHRSRRRRRITGAVRRFRIVGELVVGRRRELHVAEAAVAFLGLLEALADLLLVEPVALLQPEERPQRLALDDGVAGEVDLADLVARPFGHGHLKLDETRLAVLRVLENPELRLTDL